MSVEKSEIPEKFKSEPLKGSLGNNSILQYFKEKLTKDEQEDVKPDAPCTHSEHEQ